jgi:Fur family ferric uptake transcriptional regulator
MAKEIQYNTKHHEALIAYLKTISGQHVTINDICAHFTTGSHKMGVATVYRQMERLVQEGLVQKYIIDEKSSACFEYIGDNSANEKTCFHCKCENCGKLIHLACDEIEHMQSHFLKDHDFTLDTTRTVFYGLCSDCRKGGNA